MDVREKLVELLSDSEYMSFEKKADYLIANGATVQEWISVKDRLPEENGIYLTFNKKRQYEFHMFQTGKRVWQGIWEEDGVTHWMPLPEPPKEMIMRKHCGNCANHRKETNQFSNECGKCVAAILENGERTDPSHWKAKPQTQADRLRAMSDEELARFLADKLATESCNRLSNEGFTHTATQIESIRNTWYCAWMQWLKEPANM